MNIALFEALADLLIPKGTDMPSASEAGVGTSGLSQVLKFRPELESMVESILGQCEALAPKDALRALNAPDYSTLAEVVASAYFMNEHVRAKLHYHGQRLKPIVPEEIDPGLLKPVIDRGPIYREAL